MSTKASSAGRTRVYGIKRYLGAWFMLLLLLVGIVVIGFGYYMLKESAERSIERRVASISAEVLRETAESLNNQIRPNLTSFAQGLLADAMNLEQRLKLLPVVSVILTSSPILYSVFIGYENSDMFLVVHLDTEEKREQYSAPPATEIVVVDATWENGILLVERLYYDRNLTLIQRAADDALRGFDPRGSEWYQRAMSSPEMIGSGSIWLTRLNQPASIFVKRTRPGNSVLGITVLLRDISDMLRRELPTPGSHLALFRADGSPVASDQTIATDESGVQRLRILQEFPLPVRAGVEKYRFGERGDGLLFRDDEREWLISVREYVNSGADRSFLVLAIPRDEILSSATNFLRYSLIAMVGLLFVTMPVILLVVGRIARPLRRMTEQARHPHEGCTAGDETASSGVEELDALAQGIYDLRDHIEKILSVIRSIGSEGDIAKLIRQVFRETVAMSGADGGGMIFIDGEGEIAKNGFYYWLDGEVVDAPVPHEEDGGRYTPLSIANRAIATKGIVLGQLTRQDANAASGVFARALDDPAVVRVDVGCVALRDRNGAPLGVLYLFRCAMSKETTLTPGLMVFWESLATAVSVVLETQNLIKGQFDLRDALIHILAGAIDAKSPYTGGHCARVPVIFQMLLHAACDARDGPLADFQLDEEKWEEARLAGWLHDCGKVTTPEFVMDKATKLETLYDRIHEIRTRFEVLKRDAEIASLRAVAAGADPEVERARLEAELRALDDDFAFVASCNSGDKAMGKAEMECLAAVGRRLWKRTLDKRLGVSRDELARMSRGDTQPPPVLEPLLADCPEHIIARGPKDMLDEDNPWGFKLKIPDCLYNRGELYNLSIPRGTLTPEERYKINDHITQTIIMLQRMPLPKELAGMPEIAGAHHERMDGQGYPRKLGREQMSWSARMMAIADIFEALTAWDRPYKNSKTVSEAVKIMDKMKEDWHIDPDLYDLFLCAGIPQRYAREYLKPEQDDMPMGA